MTGAVAVRLSMVGRCGSPWNRRSLLNLVAIALERVRTVEAAALKEGATGLPHPAIPLPRDLYGAPRANSRGLDAKFTVAFGRT